MDTSCKLLSIAEEHRPVQAALTKWSFWCFIIGTEAVAHAKGVEELPVNVLSAHLGRWPRRLPREDDLQASTVRGEKLRQVLRHRRLVFELLEKGRRQRHIH